MPKLVLTRDWNHAHAPGAHTHYLAAALRPEGYQVSAEVAEAAAAAGVVATPARARKEAAEAAETTEPTPEA